MPYLAWRIPFLSTLNFNANTLRWPPYSSRCFDIILHFLCVCWFIISRRIRKGDLPAPLYTAVLSTCWLFRKMRRDWTLCGTGALPVLGASADVERESWSPGPGWVGEERRVELGVPLKPPLQIRGAERGSKWLVLCGWCETLKSQSHLQHSLHQVH